MSFLTIDQYKLLNDIDASVDCTKQELCLNASIQELKTAIGCDPCLGEKKDYIMYDDVDIDCGICTFWLCCGNIKSIKSIGGVEVDKANVRVVDGRCVMYCAPINCDKFGGFEVCYEAGRTESEMADLNKMVSAMIDIDDALDCGMQVSKEKVGDKDISYCCKTTDEAKALAASINKKYCKPQDIGFVF